MARGANKYFSDEKRNRLQALQEQQMIKNHARLDNEQRKFRQNQNWNRRVSYEVEEVVMKEEKEKEEEQEEERMKTVKKAKKIK